MVKRAGVGVCHACQRRAHGLGLFQVRNLECRIVQDTGERRCPVPPEPYVQAALAVQQLDHFGSDFGLGDLA